MRRFLALEIAEKFFAMCEVRTHLKGTNALAAVAHAMRTCAIARPAMSAATFVVPAADCCEAY
jgi:hypothetical protein